MDKNEPQQLHSHTEFFQKEQLGNIQYIGNFQQISSKNNRFSLNIAMSEMCQDLAVTSHEKLMINYFTDITLYSGGTNLQVSRHLYLINMKS